MSIPTQLIAQVIDWKMRSRPLCRLRAEWLRHAVSIPVLEIGAGSGVNFGHYPRCVKELMVTETNPALLAKSFVRAQQCGIVLMTHLGDSLARIETASVGTVVTTFALCSVTAPGALVAEIVRVLRRGGVYVMMEHGLAPDRRMQRWEKRLGGWHKRLFGCSLSNDVMSMLRGQPLERILHDEGYVNGLGRIGGYVFRSVLQRQ